MAWLVAWALVTLGFVFLAREAEATSFLRRIVLRRAIDWNTRVESDRAYIENEARRGNTVSSALRRPKYPVSRFLDAMLECAPCVSAWCSLPAAALVYGLYVLADNPWVVVMLVVACPVGAIGLLYALTVVSPVQAVSILGRTLLKGKVDAAKGKDPTG